MLRRYTPFFVLWPAHYVAPAELPSGFRLTEWSETEYEWEQDPLWGLADTAQRPAETVETGRGDCVDYALVVLSALYHRADHLELVYFLDASLPIPSGHLAVYDGRTLHSSGVRHEMTPEQYARDNDYDWWVARTVVEP